ncbi:hypothetical protein HYW17_04835 [Candidatus Uhrbacteria bacterium]|nr:hypothetical protein [Candidatus Uhrbacteria bacterium]
MRTVLRRAVSGLGLLIIAGAVLALLNNPYLNVPVLSLIVVRLIASRYFARVWAILVGLIVEINSPFPGLVYGVSVLAAYFFLEIYALHFVSRQTFLGVLICGLLTAAVAEATMLLLIFLKIGSPAGWIPHLDWAYGISALRQGALTSGAAAVIAVFGIRRYSPRLRGTVIASR